MAQLVITRDGKERVHTIKGARCTIGRRNQCDLVLKDSKISRHHATVEVNGESLTIRDEKSANGTRLNGEKLTDPAELIDGDLITIGTFEIRVVFNGKPADGKGAVAEAVAVLDFDDDDDAAGSDPFDVDDENDDDPFAGVPDEAELTAKEEVKREADEDEDEDLADDEPEADVDVAAETVDVPSPARGVFADVIDAFGDDDEDDDERVTVRAHRKGPHYVKYVSMALTAALMAGIAVLCYIAYQRLFGPDKPPTVVERPETVNFREGRLAYEKARTKWGNLVNSGRLDNATKRELDEIAALYDEAIKKLSAAREILDGPGHARIDGWLTMSITQLRGVKNQLHNLEMRALRENMKRNPPPPPASLPPQPEPLPQEP